MRELKYMAILFAVLLPAIEVSHAASCPAEKGVSLQVLGSGGPIADDERSSAGYIVWVDGKSRILVDVGGGVFLRFGEAGASYEDLDLIAISHFHTDHSADLVTFLKTGYFSQRTRNLSLAGPTSGGPFPGLDHYLDRIIGKDGAYAYLSGYLDGTGGLVQLDSVEVNAESRESMPVVSDRGADIEVDAIGVPHGIVPTIAYRIRVTDKMMVFASDQNGNDESFIDFANGADILVMHMPVPEGVTGAGRALHAPPSRIGEIANAADAKSLLVSHFMARSLQDLPGNLILAGREYSGEVVAANDLMCINLTQ